MRNILITGVDGFIGSHLYRYLSNLSKQVLGIGRRQTSNTGNYVRLELPSQNLLAVIRDFAPDVCLHCAGAASVVNSINDPIADFNANTEITINLMDAIRKNAPGCQVIYFSSAAVYGNPQILPIKESDHLAPISPYGFHKRICEQILTEYYQIYKVQSASVRVFSAYGPGLQRQLLWDICKQIIGEKAGVSLRLSGTGDETRDFIYVGDIVKAVDCLMRNAEFMGNVYNLASGTSTKIKDIAQMLIGQLCPEVSIEFSNIRREGDPLFWQADISKLKELGFIPETPLMAGMKEYAAWARGQILS